MCTHSEQIGELAAALAKAQGEIEAAEKGRENTYFHQKYATLDSVWNACRGPLSKHGLSIVQSPTADGAKVTMVTMLLHASGQWIQGEISAQAKDASPQAIGSVCTYLRRYHLMSFAGVAPDDDDAEAAQPPREQKQAKPPKATKAEPEECAEYRTLANFLRDLGCKTPEQATAVVRFAGADFAIADLRQRPADCSRVQTWLEGITDKGKILGEAIAAAAV